MASLISELLINEPIHFGHWIKSSNDDTGVDYYTFKWMIKVSKKDCVYACKAMEACEYINLDVRSHLCALVKVKEDREGRKPVIEIKPGYIYMNKTEWNMKKVPVIPKESDGSSMPGRNHTVEENKNTGCGLPKSGNFKGNMLSTGDKILLKCRLGKSSFLEDLEFVRSTCAENGTWTNPFKCQPYFNGSYYYIQETNMTWKEAKSNCESISGHLVDINSDEEQAFVVRMLDASNFSTSRFWTGGNDLETEGIFVWSDGSLMPVIGSWHGGNPNNHFGSQHCVEIRGLHKLWNDMICVIPGLSICEFP